MKGRGDLSAVGFVAAKQVLSERRPQLLVNGPHRPRRIAGRATRATLALRKGYDVRREDSELLGRAEHFDSIRYERSQRELMRRSVVVLLADGCCDSLHQLVLSAADVVKRTTVRALDVAVSDAVG